MPMGPLSDAGEAWRVCRPRTAAAARGDDPIVVSELWEVERPVDGRADLRVGCPLVPVVVRPTRRLRGPSAAQRALGFLGGRVLES